MRKRQRIECDDSFYYNNPTIDHQILGHPKVSVEVYETILHFLPELKTMVILMKSQQALMNMMLGEQNMIDIF